MCPFGGREDGREGGWKIRAVLCGEAMNQRGQSIKNTFIDKDTSLSFDARLEIGSGTLSLN